ncbi:MAG: glucosaminidase domain-containing protein [Gammaproteobacteria bacterium]
MTIPISTYNDFQGLSQLKSAASAGSPEATREAARQFEALFVQMMLKSMRDANAVLGEQHDTTYQEMFDKQIAMEMTQGKGLGLGDLMVRQLAGGAGGTPQVSGSFAMPARPPASVNLTMNRDDFRPESREAFIQEIWPLAVQAGEKLGVNPRAIVAQAALETGWGQRQIRDDAGVSGNNLFGIKADKSWSGQRVTVSTLEFEDGLPKPQRAQFRAYPNLQAGFEDYVRFLQTNPRYSDALQSGGNAQVYAERLQSAGYATDPRYAEKISDIIASPILGNGDTPLKTDGEVPNYL